MHVLRWGQSAYETDDDLDLEQHAANALGFTWSKHPDPRNRPDLTGVDLLVVTSKVAVDREVLTQVPRVLTTTSGYDHIDIDTAFASGIQVGRCPLARRDAVVEHALGGLLALSKQWPTQLRAARQGRWCRSELPTLAPLGLRDARVLVVGLGVIGTRMVDVLEALHVDVQTYDIDPARGGNRPDLDAALSDCDAVTLHCSLTPSSRGLLDARRLALLPSHAVVVNTARGGSLDVDAAVDAVRQGRLRGLAVDVFPTEPWPRLDEPHPNVWFTPHGAGYAPDLGTRVAREVGAAFAALSRGERFPHEVTAQDSPK